MTDSCSRRSMCAINTGPIITVIAPVKRPQITSPLFLCTRPIFNARMRRPRGYLRAQFRPNSETIPIGLAVFAQHRTWHCDRQADNLLDHSIAQRRQRVICNTHIHSTHWQLIWFTLAEKTFQKRSGRAPPRTSQNSQQMTFEVIRDQVIRWRVRITAH